MSIPWIAVFSENDVDRNYMCDMLSAIFKDYLKVIPVSIHTIDQLPGIPVAVMVNEVSQYIAHRYFPNSHLIYARRFISSNNLEQLVSLPPNERVLVVNYPEETAYETIKNLQDLGIDHLAFTPYWPGCNLDTSDFDIVVHAGFLHYCPQGKKRYIDLGRRSLMQSVLAEIVKIYNIPSNPVDVLQTQALHQITDGLFRIQKVLKNTRMMKENFEQVCFFSTNAILNLNKDGILMVFNPAAETLFNLSYRQAIGLNYQDVLAAYKPLLHLIEGQSEISDHLLHIRGIATLVNIRFFSVNEEPYASISLTPVETLKDGEEKARAEIHKKGFVARYTFDQIKGISPIIRQTIASARHYAQSDAAVLITGESGTGKELFAQAIHNASPRAKRPFVAVNFAAIPENLIESELFGYDEGAFTGAVKGGKPGLFRSAHTGTLFLDEIGDASPILQSRLLRAIEAQEIMPVGSSRVIPVDVRIICATNKNLAQMVAEGKFREDLYYRLKVFKLHVPALRERAEDISVILNKFTGSISIPAELQKVLLSYNWPGNIRELRSVAQYLTLYSRQGISLEDAPWKESLSIFFEQPVSSVPKPSLYEDMQPEDLAVLRCIREMNRSGQTAGRGSLSRCPELTQRGMTESKLKNRLRRLEELGYLNVGRTRQGVTLTAAALEHLESAEK